VQWLLEGEGSPCTAGFAEWMREGESEQKTIYLYLVKHHDFALAAKYGPMFEKAGGKDPLERTDFQEILDLTAVTGDIDLFDWLLTRDYLDDEGLLKFLTGLFHDPFSVRENLVDRCLDEMCERDLTLSSEAMQGIWKFTFEAGNNQIGNSLVGFWPDSLSEVVKCPWYRDSLLKAKEHFLAFLSIHGEFRVGLMENLEAVEDSLKAAEDTYSLGILNALRTQAESQE
jgi:hypothetical protein